MQPHLRIIGDVHGKQQQYLELIAGAKYSIQVGDMGFDYKLLESLDPERHRFIPGNHDNYSLLQQKLVPCALNAFGTISIPSIGPIWYMRGAWSIDLLARVPGLSWWPEEELSSQQLKEAVANFKQTKPEFVITHDAPSPAIRRVLPKGSELFESRTTRALSSCLRRHHPNRWIFGHFHRTVCFNHGTTEFQCLAELTYMDFDKRGQVIYRPKNQRPGRVIRWPSEVRRVLT